jgi:hypothetical protein
MGTDLYRFCQNLSHLGKNIVISTVRVVLGLDLLNDACRCLKSFLYRNGGWEIIDMRETRES